MNLCIWGVLVPFDYAMLRRSINGMESENNGNDNESQ